MSDTSTAVVRHVALKHEGDVNGIESISTSMMMVGNLTGPRTFDPSCAAAPLDATTEAYALASSLRIPLRTS